jgi:hypothetical protein
LAESDIKLFLSVGQADSKYVPIGCAKNTDSSFWHIVKLFLSVGLAEAKTVYWQGENTYSFIWQIVKLFVLVGLSEAKSVPIAWAENTLQFRLTDSKTYIGLAEAKTVNLQRENTSSSN